MFLHIYKIVFNKTNQELDDLYDSFSILDQERLEEISAHSYFDYDGINGDYTVFFISSPIALKTYIDILNNYYIKLECLDITKDVLSLKYNLELDLKHLVNHDNEIKFEFFIDDLNNWLLENLDIDTVLDRISEVGMDNLSELEKEFLKNYKI